MDETEVSTLYKPPRTIAQKTKHQMVALTANRGLWQFQAYPYECENWIYIVYTYMYSMNDSLNRFASHGTVFTCSKHQ